MSPKPRTLKYAETLQAAEQRIVDALPDIVDALINRAKAGDLKAAAYLCDRVMGRTAGAKIAPADDRQRPYDEATYQIDAEGWQEDDENRRLFGGMSAMSELRERLNGASNGV
jgi:hypothetical protein